MKLRKIALVLAVALGLSSLAACTDTDQKLTFTDYWEYNSLVASSSIDETLTYKVTHEKGLGLDSLGYSLTYGEGEYVTNLKTHTQGYIYTTELTIPVTFQYGEDEAETVTDSVTTEVIFQRSKNALRPISSTKHVVSHTPQNGGATSTGTCYAFYDFTVATSYPAEGKATSVATYTLAEGDPVVMESTFDANDEKYSYLDNEQLLLALRAISTSVSSASVKIYSPFVEAQQKIDLSFSAVTGGEFTLNYNGVSEKKTFSYRPVTLVIDDRNPGATQEAWIVTSTDAQKNVYGNMMLKLTVPLSYSMGSLVYELVSATRAY